MKNKDYILLFCLGLLFGFALMAAGVSLGYITYYILERIN